MDYQPPSKCPVCTRELRITRLTCPHCQSELTGSFQPCRYCALSEKHQLFLETFLRCRGSIKDAGQELSLSYPTVRGLLDETLEALFPDEHKDPQQNIPPAQVLDRLEGGEINADEAAVLLQRWKGQEK